jgi:L-galactose dehydrogenase
MKYNLLGKTQLKVSALSFGSSALGGVFTTVDESTAIKAVHAALDAGINYFDTAPAYGATKSEIVLGKALKGISRDKYILSTKIGKYAAPIAGQPDVLDYSEKRTYQSIQESAERIGTDYFDIIHIHDIEYHNRTHTEWALQEGYDAVCKLKKEGRIGAVSFGIYPIDLWERIFENYAIDAALVHNHYCLNDTLLENLLPEALENGIGIINASPFASGLLTERGTAAWHPANAEERSLFAQAAELCKARGSNIAKLALQFAVSNAQIPTTMFSSANPQSVKRNLEWYEEKLDDELVKDVIQILQPVMNKQWNY